MIPRHRQTDIYRSGRAVGRVKIAVSLILQPGHGRDTLNEQASSVTTPGIPKGQGEILFPQIASDRTLNRGCYWRQNSPRPLCRRPKLVWGDKARRAAKMRGSHYSKGKDGMISRVRPAFEGAARSEGKTRKLEIFGVAARRHGKQWRCAQWSSRKPSRLEVDDLQEDLETCGIGWRRGYKRSDLIRTVCA